MEVYTKKCKGDGNDMKRKTNVCGNFLYLGGWEGGREALPPNLCSGYTLKKETGVGVINTEGEGSGGYGVTICKRMASMDKISVVAWGRNRGGF